MSVLIVAAAFVLWFTVSHAHADLSTGLLAHWNFDEGSGTTAADSSGNGNTGTVVGSPTWVPGIDGNAVHFDGTGAAASASNTVKISNSSNLTSLNTHTISLWVKFDPGYLGGTCQWANLVGRTLGYDLSYMIYINKNGHIRAHIEQSNSSIDLFDSAALIPTGQWVNITQVADGSQLHMYINGVEDTNSPRSYDGTIKSLPTASTYIGQDTRECALKGSIDDVRIYNRALTSTEADVIADEFTPVAVTTTFLPDGTIGVPYSQALAAKNGTPAYSWSVVSGALPDGLNLNTATGVISGNATTEGTYNFTVRATDSKGQTADKALSIKIVVPAILTYVLPDATLGATYSQTLQAGGGTTPYTWSVTAGALPAGLTLNTSTGKISGAPTISGTSTFTVVVQDNSGGTDNQVLTIVAHTPPQITTTALNDGEKNTPYSAFLTATGGTEPYTWSLVSGSLPSGLTLDTSLGEISGTPTVEGTFNFTVKVQDSYGITDTKALSLTITPQVDQDGDGVPSSVENAGPNGGDADNDGMLDSTEGNVASFVNPVTGKYTVLALDAACQITTVSVGNEAADVVVDSTYDYPAGLMNFTANCGTPGYTAHVSQYYFGAVDSSALLRKYNTSTQSYSTVEGANITQSTLGGQAFTKAAYQLVDGGSLDADSVADGNISDPAGLGIRLASASGGSLTSTGVNILISTVFAVAVIAVSVAVRQYGRRKTVQEP